MDSLVDEACGYGRYQRVLLWLVLYPAQVSCGPQLYGQLLMFLEPDHWCRGSPPPEHWANGTERLQLCTPLPNVSSACPDGYEYDRRFLGDDETAVTQWDLVCNRRILATLSMFLFGTGLLAGHFLSVLVSHRWGQRASFTTFLFVQCLFGMLAALSSKFLIFLLFRTLVAVGTAGTWTSLSILVGDLAGRRHRAGALVCSRLAHGLGLLLLGLVSLAVRGWGHLAAATSVPFVAFLVYWRCHAISPFLVSVCLAVRCALIIPNSPKWLLARGKLDRVEQLLVAIAHTNGRQVDYLYSEKLRTSLTRLSGRGCNDSTAILHFPAPRVQSARRRRVVVVLIVGLLTGAVSLAQVYLAASLAGNSYLHLLLMSCAELSACVAPHWRCSSAQVAAWSSSVAACPAEPPVSPTWLWPKYDCGGRICAGRPCLSLCLLAVAKASVGSSLAVLPAWLLEGAPCTGHHHLTHLAQVAELAAFPVVPLFFPADSPEATLAVLSALLAFSCALSVLACDTRRVRGLWCLWRPDGPWGAWSWDKSRDMKCRSIAWEFKYPQVPSPIPRWHLGYCNWSYTPTARGFDSFSGFYLGSQDHYSHTAWVNKDTGGFDYRANATPDWDARNQYSSKLLADDTIKVLADHAGQDRPLFLYVAFQAVHAPLQVPPEYEVPCAKYQNTNRRIVCGMVNALDEAVGRIEKALLHYGYWNNTLLVFSSDNGGQILFGGNNWPLRGNKNTLWEGGTRVPAFVAGPVLKKSGYTNSKVVHAVDWFPTLLNVAGMKDDPGSVDGVNQWEVLSEDAAQVRHEFVYNIRKRAHLQGAIRDGDYKFILGDAGHPNGWYPEPDFDEHFKKPDSRNISRALFNIRSDPEEKHDLSSSQPQLVKLLEKRLRRLARSMVPEDNPSADPRGDPRRWGGVYTPGWCTPRT
ncbi:hypothetical protein MTO96_016845 [Rhipicephalus appendiculatus]